MKTNLIFLILFLACKCVFAQVNNGISVQGIARNAQKAALVDELLTFTFDIQSADGGTSFYKEDVDITTDPYGVFSHIIGTGNKLAGSGNFNAIPFSHGHKKLVIRVEYNGSDIIVSNAPFTYTPYARSAENGVPTGTIVAFAGIIDDLPVGWVMCDGGSLTAIPGSENLRKLLGSDNAPNLKGMFLRGTGTSPVNGQSGPALRATQQDTIQSHNHPDDFSIPSGGTHTHTFADTHMNENASGGVYANGDGTGSMNESKTTTTTGSAHTHTINGSVLSTGDAETRPVNYGVNYIIKL